MKIKSDKTTQNINESMVFEENSSQEMLQIIIAIRRIRENNKKRVINLLQETGTELIYDILTYHIKYKTNLKNYLKL